VSERVGPLFTRPPDRGVATARSETRDQLGEVVQVLVATLIVPRRMQPKLHGDPPSKDSCMATVRSSGRIDECGGHEILLREIQ
jgi:hypothetical protein